jgi:hypothetical protein
MNQSQKNSTAAKQPALTILTGISDFNFTFAHKHTPVVLMWKAHIAMAAMGGESRRRVNAMLIREVHARLYNQGGQVKCDDEGVRRSPQL